MLRRGAGVRVGKEGIGGIDARDLEDGMESLEELTNSRLGSVPEHKQSVNFHHHSGITYQFHPFLAPFLCLQSASATHFYPFPQFSRPNPFLCPLQGQ